MLRAVPGTRAQEKIIIQSNPETCSRSQADTANKVRTKTSLTVKILLLDPYKIPFPLVKYYKGNVKIITLGSYQSIFK